MLCRTWWDRLDSSLRRDMILQAGRLFRFQFYLHIARGSLEQILAARHGLANFHDFHFAHRHNEVDEMIHLLVLQTCRFWRAQTRVTRLTTGVYYTRVWSASPFLGDGKLVTVDSLAPVRCGQLASTCCRTKGGFSEGRSQG